MAKKATTKKSGAAAKEAAPKKVQKEFKHGETYTFKGNGVAPSLLKDMEYKVSAFQAKLFTDKGYGQVID
jgi:DNA-binding protein H-NS